MGEHIWLRFVLDWLGLPALALLAIVLIYRRWGRVFPYFLIYVITAEAIGLIRLVAARIFPEGYSKIYWISDTVLVAAAFLATYEVLVKRLFPGFYRVRLYRSIFPIAAILITILMILSALFGNHFSRLAMAIHTVEFIRGAALFFFVLLMIVMGRRWEKQEFGIAFGFALDVSATLMLLSTWTHADKRASLADWSVVAYDIACIVWLYCFWADPKNSGTISFPPISPENLRDARKWEETLKDYIAPGKR
ncbi:MAG TPA: hypothetical protein VGK36_14660 [Candidatus Angelobacter sp.]|jgi:hypothetical protein